MHSLIKALTYISNMIKLKRDVVDVPYSLLIQKCLNILLNEGYILGYQQKNSNYFRVFLKYYKGKSVINEIKWISKPGFRRYIKVKSVFNKYNTSDLVFLSTTEGILSNLDLLNSRSIFLNNTNRPIGNIFNFFNKTMKMNSIENNLVFNLSYNKWNYFSFYNIFFHKNLILKSFFRKKGIMNKLSKRQYFRNKKLRLFFKKYYSTFFLKNKYNVTNTFLSLSLKHLYFFKFKTYFTNYRYVHFKKAENFNKFVLKTNKIHFFSVFYFLFYLKQFAFSKYKFRFSLYLKYINHLLFFNQKNELNSVDSFKKYKNGGELLFTVR